MTEQQRRLRAIAMATFAALGSTACVSLGLTEKKPTTEQPPATAAQPAPQPPAATPGPAPGPAAARAAQAPAAVPAPPPPAPAQPPAAVASEERSRIYQGSGALVNPRPGKFPPPPPGEEVMPNFEGLDIRIAVQQVLGDMLREPFIIDPAVAGTMTIRTTKPIPKSALIPLLETVLRQNGHALIKEDNIWKVVPLAKVRGQLTPQLGSLTTPLPQGFSVVVVPVRYLGVKEMQRLLQPFTPDGFQVITDDARNLLILAGTQSEIKHLIETIDLFDVDWISGMSVGIFSLQSAGVKDVDQELQKIFGDKAGGPLAGVVRFIAIDRLNAFLVVTPQPKYLEQAKIWIERLDKAGGASGGTKLYVYQVQNSKAETLAGLLNELFQKKGAGATTPPATLAPGQRPATVGMTPSPTAPTSPTTPGIPPPGAQPAQTSQNPQATSATLAAEALGTSGDVRVIADKDQNALLVLASPPDYEKIEAALKKLDVPQRQVLVEVNIAEVTLTEDLTLGFDWFLSNKVGRSVTGSLSGRDGGGTIPSPFAGTATTPFGQGLSLIKTLPSGQIVSILTALESAGRAKRLASPNVAVIDNQSASFQVGDRISVTTGSQSVAGTSNNLITTTQYLDTGIILNVTPRISSGGRVTLELNQEVSTADPQTGAGGNPNIARRAVKSTVTVASGETMVMAGLIQTNRSRGSSGLPFLSRIPIIGAALGQQRMNETRTELIVLITPRVLTDSNDARQATDELKRKLPMLEEFFPRPKDYKEPGLIPRALEAIKEAPKTPQETQPVEGGEMKPR